MIFFVYFLLLDNCIKLEGIGYLNYYECVDKFISGCLMMLFIDEDIYDCK